MNPNQNWYYEVDLRSKEAFTYSRLPEFYTTIQLQGASDEALSDLSFAVPGLAFLRHDAALKAGFKEKDLQRARENSRHEMLQFVRQQRDYVLAQTDCEVLIDRWMRLDREQKKRVADYRQQLRDITKGDIFNIVWPKVPAEIKSLHTLSWPYDIPLSDELKRSIDAPR